MNIKNHINRIDQTIYTCSYCRDGMQGSIENLNEKCYELYELGYPSIAPETIIDTCSGIFKIALLPYETYIAPVDITKKPLIFDIPDVSKELFNKDYIVSMYLDYLSSVNEITDKLPSAKIDLDYTVNSPYQNKYYASVSKKNNL